MTEAELHANYERAITRQTEEFVATIVRQEGEIERLRAERDELRAICGKFVRHWDEYIDDDTNGLIEALESIIDDARRAAGRGPEAAP
jgi:hypothetical protein